MKIKKSNLCIVFAFFMLLASCGISTPSSSTSEHVPSDDASFELYGFADILVEDDKIAFNLDSEMSAYLNLSSQELLDLSIYDSASKSSINAFINSETKVLSYVVTLESKSNSYTYNYSLTCKDVFKRHSYCYYGSENAFDYIAERGGYYLSALGGNNGASFYYDGYNPLKGDYFSMNFRVNLSSSVSNSEFKVILMSKQAQEARFVLRQEQDQETFLMFTDGRSSSGYVNYKVHKNLIEGNVFDIEILKHKDEAMFLLNNELLCRIEVGYLGDVETFLGGYNLEATVSNITYETVNNVIEKRYQSILNSTTYVTPNWSKSVTGNGSPEEFIVQSDGSTFVDRSDDTSRIIAAPTVLSEPVVGDYLYLAGHAKLENTPTSGETAGKIEFQFYTPDGLSYFKLFIYRFQGSYTNNSIYLEWGNTLRHDYQQLYRYKQNVLAVNESDGSYEFDYALMFDRGVLHIMLLDKSMSVPFVFSKDVGWAKAAVLYGVNCLCDVTYSPIEISRDFEYTRRKIKAMQNFNEDLYSFQEGNITKSFDSFLGEYTRNEVGSYLYKKDSKCYASDFLLDAKLTINNADSGSYCYFELVHDERNAIRYTISMNNAGNIGINQYVKNNTSYFVRSKTLINPDVESYSNLNLRIVGLDGHYYFFLDGFCLPGLENSSFPIGETAIKVAGYDMTIRLTGLRYKTDINLITQKVENIEYHVEKSKFERRILQYEQKYKDVTSCDLLLMGSSSFDYWYTFKEDLDPLTNIVNVGIGGSGIVDWNKYMLDRLVTKFNPSYILVYLGGNDLTAGVSMDEILRQTEEAFLKIHETLPEAKIYILGQKPYVSTVEKMNNCKELNERSKVLANKYDWIIRYIDNWDNYWEDESQNKLVAAYFKSDNMHLTEEGYKVWSAYVKAGIPELYN